MQVFQTLPWLDFHSIRDDDAQKAAALQTALRSMRNSNIPVYKDDWATNTYWNDHYFMINLANKELYTAIH